MISRYVCLIFVDFWSLFFFSVVKVWQLFTLGLGIITNPVCDSGIKQQLKSVSRMKLYMPWYVQNKTTFKLYTGCLAVKNVLTQFWQTG